MVKLDYIGKEGMGCLLTLNIGQDTKDVRSATISKARRLPIRYPLNSFRYVSVTRGEIDFLCL